MARRFGRNRKKKLLNEINDLKKTVATYKSVSPFENVAPVIINQFSYNDLEQLYTGEYSGTINNAVSVKPAQYDIIKTRSEIYSYDFDRTHTLVLGVKIGTSAEMRYMINTEYVIDLIKNNVPMHALYEQIYKDFVKAIDEKVKSLI